jgi:glycosyl transferase, family 25
VTGTTKVVVISLPDAADRRTTFTQRARGTTLEWTWFDAQRELAPGLTHDPDEAIVAKGRPMYPGELGCYSSHYAAWLMFLESGAPQLLVLEDDTIVDWGFLEKLAAVDFQAAGLAYLRLYAKRPCALREVLRNAIERQRTLVEYLDRPLGTQGYVMTREGARRFVRHCRVVRRPLDDELDRSWDHGIACLGIFPFPVIEQSTASSIGDDRFERFTIPPRLRARRQAMKMRDRILKLRQRARRLTTRRASALRALAAR